MPADSEVGFEVTAGSIFGIVFLPLSLGEFYHHSALSIFCFLQSRHMTAQYDFLFPSGAVGHALSWHVFRHPT